jgi:N-acetyl-anhydromuramyl-L-alanine amidase AmpD
MSPDEGIEEIRALHLGWGFEDVGYHFVIDNTGRVWEGRPVDQQGAHVKGDNVDSIGVCLCGNFEEEKPLESQIKALTQLILDLCERFGKLKVLGHREFPESDTLCPGRYLAELLPGL